MIENEVRELRLRVARLERTLDIVMRQLGIQVPADQPILGVSAQVAMLARSGDKIHAIKAYRDETGAGLAEAKRIVDEIV